MVKLMKMVIHQRQIPVQQWGAFKPPSTIIEEGIMVDTEVRKMIGLENTRWHYQQVDMRQQTQKIWNLFYASIQSWVIEVEYVIPFTDWKGVD